MEIKIRPAVFADIDTILEIINHEILHGTSNYDYEPRDFETQKIGYQYTVEHSVYVAEEFIGNGVGKLLLAELIRLAKEQGYHNMIGAIDAKNKGSIAFHKKFGFEVAGTIREVGYKFDHWL